MPERKRRDIHNSPVPAVCRSCEARHGGVCGALTPEELSYLSRFTTRRLVEAGQTLVEVGADQTSYSNILSGVIKLSKLMPDGRQQIVGLQFAPDFVGRPFESRSQVGAEAATTVRLCTFPKKVLDEIMRHSPDMEHRLHEQTLRELDEAREWLMTLGRKTAAERVASFLVMIVDHIDPERGEDGPVRAFELPLRRADIADFLGLTIETVSRQLTRLRKERIVAIEQSRHVRILDIAALRAIAAGD